MSGNVAPNLLTNSLVLYLDASNSKSYISGSTVWYDLSGRNNNGTLVSNPIFSSSNKGNIIFDGVDDSVTFPITSDFLFLNAAPYTLSIFAKINVANSNFQGLINREYGSPRNGYNLWFYRDSANAVAIASERFGGTGQKVVFVLLENSKCINVWNHYCVTYDGSNLIFYLNGEFKNGVVADGNITNTSDTLQIARRQTTNGNCAVASTQIYNIALSEQQIKQNYNTLKSRFGLT
jgi:hypothetical protein